MTNRTNRRERGFSLIELMIAIAIIGILVGVGVPVWRNAVISANETAAIQNLRTIATEQRTYYNMKGRTNYAASFDEMRANEALDKRFTGDQPVVDGYVYTMKSTPRSASAPASFSVNADPQKKDGIGATGGRHFYIDSNVGSVRANASGPAGPNDSPEGEASTEGAK